MNGRRLREAIKASDYPSFAAFARDIGYTTVSLSNLLAGKSDCKSSLVGEMVLKLRKHNSFVDSDYLLGIKDTNDYGEMIAFKKQRSELLKFSSNWMNPQLPFPECSRQKSAVFA